ncbi:hypothetical protein ACTMSW_25460 [Micromonospora sp. BQ11]|uniref:hypothetical protein n=1 Tax=Micromonospora sp. BQ11 TaxID=3452212 RepID=UPI003F8A89FE
MHDASPFFIAPHRFDAPDDDTGPVLDRRHRLALESGEQTIGRYLLHAEGHLLDPTEGWRCWSLPEPVEVNVTDRRIAYAGTGSQLSVAGAASDPRHRRAVRLPGLVSGQIRWQWPSRLELSTPTPDGAARLLVVCDALRTIRQPALALTGPADVVAELARQVRRAVAAFRLTHPELVDLSPPERDVLVLRARPALPSGTDRVTLPGALPVEFHSRDDYYRRGQVGRAWPGPAAGAASGHR